MMAVDRRAVVAVYHSGNTSGVICSFLLLTNGKIQPVAGTWEEVLKKLRID